MSDNGPSWPSEDDGGTTPPPPPPSGGGQQPSGGRSPAPHGGQQGASVGVRLGARIIDGIIVGIAAGIVGLVLGFGATAPGAGVNYVATLAGVLIAVGYYVGLEVTQGATLGKKLLGLQVHGADGGYPTPEESLRRNCWYAFSIVPVVGQLAQFGAAVAAGVTISSSDDNRGWHDRFGGTVVTRS